MLPIMIGALFSMLQGYAALPWLTVGFPIAALAALTWTWLQIRGQVCEVTITQGSVAVRSLFEAASPVSDPEWKLIIDVSDHGDHALITIGLASIRLNREDWPLWHTMLPILDYAHAEQSE